MTRTRVLNNQQGEALMKIRLLAVVSALVLPFIPITADAALVQIDAFTIIKNGNTIFQDAFSNGSPPPDQGGYSQSYTVRGGPLGPESNGNLVADNGEAVIRPDAGNMRRQGARVNTNIDQFNLQNGLKIDDTFEVSGLFDITQVTRIRERYGIRLVDGGSSQLDDSIGVSVMRTAPSLLEVVLHRHDRDAFTFTDLASFTLETNHDQILMSLSRLSTANNEITATFSYLDAGSVVSTTTFGTTATIFNGENFTRAQFMYLAPVPVPGAVWLFGAGLIGLCGIGGRGIRGG
jgi:hypothetical protein